MVKKVKRFVIFVLFAFFHSLLMGKVAEAGTGNKVYLIPKEGDKLKYNGVAQEKDAEVAATESGY